jgi:ABC-type nitrate/sulfonate/bicarbonate transport system ATPase subunit
MITATDLSRTYPDGTVALASTNITIPKGQFVALIGPSGCGKSTLINLLAGLDQPTAGTANIAGRSAMVFQEPALFPWLNIRDNIEFGGSSAVFRSASGVNNLMRCSKWCIYGALRMRFHTSSPAGCVSVQRLPVR